MPTFSPELEQSLHRAVALANQRKHEYATLEHLLLSLTDDADAAAVMRACNVDLASLKKSLTDYLDAELKSLVVDGDADAKPTPGFHRVVQRAVIHIQSSGRDDVTGANVLLAIFSERESHAAYFLQQQEMNRADAVNFIAHGIAKNSAKPARRGAKRKSAILKPRPTPGPYSVKWRAGRIEAKPTLGRPFDAIVAQDMLDALLEHAASILNYLVGNVIDPALSSAIRKLIEDLSHSASEIPVGRLQIDVRIIQGLALSYSSSTGDHDLTIAGLVRGLSEGLLDFTTQYRSVREMEAGRIALGLAATENIESLTTPIAQIADIADKSSVVDGSVVRALTEGSEEVEALNSKIEDSLIRLDLRAKAINQRSEILGQQLLTVWNFGAAAFKKGVTTAASAAGEGIKTGFRKGVERTVSATVTGAASALAVHLGEPMVALSLVVETFAPLAKLSESTKDETENG